GAALRRCRRRGELTVGSEGILLTTRGREKISGVIRGHRLWESYMIHEMGTAADHVHDAADLIAPHLQPTLVKELEKLLGNPELDPHGSEIP
ncbi:MAG: zinc ABC transporter permease, partial [Planctomycetes bacterium]|nr:zinc ABC transporter permease [Planctomycetota bacterium]